MPLPSFAQQSPPNTDALSPENSLILDATPQPDPTALPPAPATGMKITTSPIPINLITKPGTTVSTPLRIKNDGSETEQLQVSVMKFGPYDTSGRPRIMDPGPTDDFINWIHFSERQFSVQPGEWKTVTATINVPPQAAFGYYYAVIFSRANSPVPEPGQAVVVGGSAVLLLLEARVPQAVRNVEVMEFKPDRAWYEYLPAILNIKLRNSGNVHVAPRGNIFINRAWGGKNISILEVNERQGSILPDSNRDFKAIWADGFPHYENQVENDQVVLDDDGQPQLDLTWDYTQAHKLRWGKYTAQMLLVYDNGERDIPIEATTSFWVLPWRILTVLAVILLIILIGIMTIWHSLFRRVFRRPRQAKRNTKSAPRTVDLRGTRPGVNRRPANSLRRPPRKPPRRII